MNKNYREWSSANVDSAFQNKLDRIRDLHDLEVLTARYSKFPVNAPPAEPEPKFPPSSAFRPSDLRSPVVPPATTIPESQEDSKLPIDKESLLYNRSHFEDTLEYETNRALRYHRHLSVCLVRMDELDYMHSSLNSQELSRLIFRLARAFKDMLRGIDIPARIDQKTFAVILPETTSEGATVVAERIRSVFKNVIAQDNDPNVQKITARPSVGCACFPSHAKTASGLADSAMKSLETAVSRGGDVVCML